MDRIDALIQRLRTELDDEDAIDAIKAELTELAAGPQGAEVRSYLESAARKEVLEVQWELEEVVEATTPRKAEPKPKAPEPEPEPEPQEKKRLTAADLELVYDDPSGLALHRTKDGARWFATQMDPRTRQPQTFELHPMEVAQLQQQLAGSPYWRILGQ